MTRLPRSLAAGLSGYRDRLRVLFGGRVRELRLFGSFARGEADEDSDVDVLVVIDGLTDIEAGVAAGEAAHILAVTGLPLAPLPMSTERWERLRTSRTALACDIEEQGVSL